MLLSCTHILTFMHHNEPPSENFSLPNILNIYHVALLFGNQFDNSPLFKTKIQLTCLLVAQKSGTTRLLATKGVRNEAYFENNRGTNFVEKACASNGCQMSLLHLNFLEQNTRRGINRQLSQEQHFNVKPTVICVKWNLTWVKLPRKKRLCGPNALMMPCKSVRRGRVHREEGQSLKDFGLF